MTRVPPALRLRPPLIAIGCSAGGPGALATILRDLPKDFPAAIVIVQHVDESFAAAMATWLDQTSPLDVRLAVEGDDIEASRVLLADAGRHLIMRASGQLGYSAEPRGRAHMPSIDVFFESVCLSWTGPVVGVVLTGMGQDGAAGLKALRDRHHHTIAQDEQSSAVYGMPKAAAGLKAAIEILPLTSIASRLMRITGTPARMAPLAG